MTEPGRSGVDVPNTAYRIPHSVLTPGIAGLLPRWYRQPKRQMLYRCTLLLLIALALLAANTPTAFAAPVAPPYTQPRTVAEVGNAASEVAQLRTYLEETRQPLRVVQVDLTAHPKISQFSDINSSPSGYGPNACGLVAAAAAVGGPDWPTLVGKIAKAAGRNYKSWAGIQPSPYVGALEKVFGERNVTAASEMTLDQLYQNLAAGQVVIVDIKVNPVNGVPSSKGPNLAHFARVLGMDLAKQEIYVENTLSGRAFWSVPISSFLEAWELPETSSTIIPDPRHAEEVTRWAVMLDQAAIAGSSNTARSSVRPVAEAVQPVSLGVSASSTRRSK